MASSDRDPFGFSQWLNSTLDDLSKISLKKPTGTLDQMSFEAAFGVTLDKSANGTLQLAFVTGDLKLAESRNDLQRLKVVISPAPIQAGGKSSGSGGGNTSAPPSLGPAMPRFPNFSSSASTDD
jgi:hypothetical protein